MIRLVQLIHHFRSLLGRSSLHSQRATFDSLFRTVCSGFDFDTLMFVFIQISFQAFVGLSRNSIRSFPSRASVMPNTCCEFISGPPSSFGHAVSRTTVASVFQPSRPTFFSSFRCSNRLFAHSIVSSFSLPDAIDCCSRSTRRMMIRLNCHLIALN